MDSAPPFLDEPANGRERIMRATYVVLQERGYAGLSIQRIADEAGLSKSSVYYHFEDKDELLIDFLQFAVAEFEGRFEECSAEDPLDLLRGIVDRMVLGERPVDGPSGGTNDASGVVIEVWAQAVHDDEYGHRIGEVDAGIRDVLASIIADGVESGRFADVDAGRVAETLLTVFLGAMLRRTTTPDPDLEAVREDVHEYLDRSLLAPGRR